jgi:hypothetical protein
MYRQICFQRGGQAGGDVDDGEGALWGGERNQVEFAGLCRMLGTKNTRSGCSGDKRSENE